MAELWSFVDESFREGDGGGYYVLAAAVLPVDRHEELRSALRHMRGGRRTQKLHWNDMDRLDRLHAAKRIADFGELNVVCVGTPVPRKRQERARAMCLSTLVGELPSVGVEYMVAEARTKVLDGRDVDTVRGARFALPEGSRLRIDHVRGVDEPLLWAADVVAGAVRLRRDGERAPWELLRCCLREIDVDTRLS